MPTPILYYVPGNASLAPHIVFEEIAAPYELRLVDRDSNEHKSADYLKLNPSGLIPALVDGDLVLTEAAAICLYLADRHPESKLAPAFGTPERALFYKWLMYLTNTLQAELITYFYPHRLGSESAKDTVQANAEARVGAMLDLIENQLAANASNQKGPWLTGRQYTVVDAYLMMLCRWTRGFKHPARARPHLNSFLAAMLARPAVARVFEQEGLLSPPY